MKGVVVSVRSLNNKQNLCLCTERRGTQGLCGDTLIDDEVPSATKKLFALVHPEGYEGFVLSNHQARAQRVPVVMQETSCTTCIAKLSRTNRQADSLGWPCI